MLVTICHCDCAELSEKLDNELRELRVAHQLLKEQNDELRHKMSFFIKVSGLNISTSLYSVKMILIGEHCRLE